MSSLAILDVFHRPNIDVSSPNPIVNQRKPKDETKKETAPVHAGRRGSGAAGKNKKIKATPRNKRARPLTRNPILPRLNREGRRASPLIRFANTQEMTTMYEDTSPSCPRDVMTLNAIVDPMMMSESRVVQPKVTRTAFTGTSQPGRTWSMLATDGNNETYASYIG